MVSKRRRGEEAGANGDFRRFEKPTRKKKNRRYNDIEVVCVLLGERSECSSEDAVERGKTKTGWDEAVWRLNRRNLRCC